MVALIESGSSLNGIGNILTKSIWSDPIFRDDTAARAWLEVVRWPHGPVCPHCKWTKHYRSKKVGVYRCADMTCARDFTVITATVMAHSHARLAQWLIAFHLAASSKKDVSIGQLQGLLGCHYYTARSLLHRVSKALRRGSLELPPTSGDFACAVPLRASLVSTAYAPPRQLAVGTSS